MLNILKCQEPFS